MVNVLQNYYYYFACHLYELLNLTNIPGLRWKITDSLLFIYLFYLAIKEEGLKNHYEVDTANETINIIFLYLSLNVFIFLPAQLCHLKPVWIDSPLK